MAWFVINRLCRADFINQKTTHDGISCKDEESYVTTLVALERCDNALLVLTGSPSGGLTHNLSGLSEGGQAPEPVLTRQPKNWSRRAQMLCERTRTVG